MPACQSSTTRTRALGLSGEPLCHSSCQKRLPELPKEALTSRRMPSKPSLMNMRLDVLDRKKRNTQALAKSLGFHEGPHAW